MVTSRQGFENKDNLVSNELIGFKLRTVLRRFCNIFTVVNFQVLLSPTSWHQLQRFGFEIVSWKKHQSFRQQYLATNSQGTYLRYGIFFSLGFKILKFVSGSNPCQKNNGGCSHLCLYRRRGVKCECPDGMEILADKKSCICKCTFGLFSMEIVTIHN